MQSSQLILVGGFLGAGKTTLLWEAADRLMQQGKKVGLVTNDQAPELVDTALLLRRKVPVTEVSGSCFCCNFNGLLAAVDQLQAKEAPQIIIAEPVGSCTDLSATIIQPLKAKMNGRLKLSPFTVLADPVPLTDILFGGTAGLHSSAAYIFLKQLEESDIILISKSDLLTSAEMEVLKEKVRQRFPHALIRTLSTVTGEGLQEWLEEVQHNTFSGMRIVDLDYDIYAQGEAVLGWLNTSIELASESTDWEQFIKRFMKDLSRRFDDMQAQVGHVKVLIESGEEFMTGNLTGASDTLNFRGAIGIHSNARCTLNARVQLEPEMLEKLVRSTLADHLQGKINSRITAFRCLSPARPTPTFRFNNVIV